MTPRQAGPPKPPSKRPSAGSRSATAAAPTDEGVRHLRAADPVMRRLVHAHGPLTLAERRRGRPKEAYGALLRSIVGQQLSTKAARSIYERLAALFGGTAPASAELLAVEPEALRAVGLSWRKVDYLRDLAQRVEDGSLDLRRLRGLSDDEVTAELTQVRGLGPWTADMFMIFHLGRPDVLAVGDLGTRAAVRREYELEALPTPEEFRRIAEPWHPHRSLACLYLWRSLDAVPVTS